MCATTVEYMCIIFNTCCTVWQERERLLLIERERVVPENHWEEQDKQATGGD